MGFFSFFRRRRRSDLESRGPASSNRRRRVEPDAPLRGRPISHYLVTALMLLLVWAVAVFSYLERSIRTVDFVVGQTSGTNVFAEVDFDYIDFDETSRQQQSAANNAIAVYRLDGHTTDDVKADFKALFDFLAKWEPPSTGAPVPVRTGQDAVFAEFGPKSLSQLKELLDKEGRAGFVMPKLAFVMQKMVAPAGSSETKAPGDGGASALSPPPTTQIHVVTDDGLTMDADLREIPTPQEAAEALMADIGMSLAVADPESLKPLADVVFARLIRPNLTYDAALTLKAKEQMIANVSQVKRAVRRGDKFIGKGTVIKPQDISILKAHNEALNNAYDTVDYLRRIVAFLLLSLMVVVGGAVFLHVGQPKLGKALSRIVLVGTVIALNLLLIWAVEQGLLHVLQDAQVYIYAAMPLFLTSVLLSLLLGPPVGISAGVVLALLTTLTTMTGEGSVHVLILGVAQAVVGGLSVRSVRTRLQTFRAALYTPLTVFLVECVFLFLNWTPMEYILFVLLIAFGTALLGMMLVNLLLPLFEWMFGITTNISLLELSDLNHPLLKRLTLEAPGTYHHTLMVATLAEHAAEAIGANTLLARVASYYHDIGKMSNPSYFTENNFGQKNQHDDLNPHMSARIIVNHVKEGLELAKTYKLRAPIREAIASHHGTSLVFFFYHRARQERKGEGDGAVDEASFRYPGPLPRSPECTIISIADSCEAASRSLAKPTPQRIDALVNEIVRNRLLDGQLDESELTMDELNRAVEAIKRTLRSMLHSRVSYPKADDDADPDATPAPVQAQPQSTTTPGPTSPRQDPGSSRVDVVRAIAETTKIRPEDDPSATRGGETSGGRMRRRRDPTNVANPANAANPAGPQASQAPYGGAGAASPDTTQAITPNPQYVRTAIIARSELPTVTLPRPGSPAAVAADAAAAILAAQTAADAASHVGHTAAPTSPTPPPSSASSAGPGAPPSPAPAPSAPAPSPASPPAAPSAPAPSPASPPASPPVAAPAPPPPSAPAPSASTSLAPSESPSVSPTPSISVSPTSSPTQDASRHGPSDHQPDERPDRPAAASPPATAKTDPPGNRPL